MTSIPLQAELVPGEQPEAKTKAFQQFQQTYGPAVEKQTNDSNTSFNDHTSTEEEDLLEDLDTESASLLDVLASLSILFLWFQRSTFGAVGLMRSLVFGHFLQFFVVSTVNTLSKCCSSGYSSSSSEYIDAESHHQGSSGVQKYFRLMQSLLFGNGSSATNSSTPHKQINGSWPPPALVALAVLTILALVVHPDGLTWIMLRKIRDAFMSLLQSSSTCLDFMIRDFGVLGTVSASASIVLVLILAIVMHKAFLSNCCHSTDGDAASTKRRSVAAEKKRRRRKGHSNRGGRIKGGPSSGAQSSPSILCPRLPKVEEVASDGASDSSGEMCRDMLAQTEDDHVQTSCEDETENLDTKPSSDHLAHNEEEGASIMTSPSALESVVSEDFSSKGRTPVPSVCTVDTAVMSDDISCESFSVRSVQQQQPVRHTKSRANKSKGNATRGGKAISNVSPGPKQPKSTPKTNANARNMPTMPRSDTRKTKPHTKPNAPASDAPAKFEQQKESYAQKRSDEGYGRPIGTQNSRKGRGKGGRVAKSQKNQPAPLSVTKASTQNPKSSPNPYSAKLATPGTDSPVAQVKNVGMNSNPDTRLPPISPYSQSLFSAEIGASGWSLPTLPAVTQLNTNDRTDFNSLTPSLIYQTNPFAPYSHMPDENNSAGRVTPVTFAEGGGSASLGLWNSVESGSAPRTTETYDLQQFTTPTRPVRPPPGLPTPPPGFSEASISQPILSTGSEFSTPASTFSKMQTTPTVCHPSSPLILSGFGNRSVGPSPAMSTTNTFPIPNSFSSLNENPFADKGSLNEADSRIEAELQELGGQMVGSVLDF